MARYLEIAGGILIIAAVAYDLFQSVVLPRPAVGRVRLAQQILRPLWVSWRWIGTRSSRSDRRENLLATFGPLSLILLLGFWGLALTLGYGLVMDGLRDQIQPAPADFWNALYFSGGTLLPLSYGDIVPMGGEARIAILAESATGVALIALVISLLFSLYGSFQEREELVVTLDALAGAPPSGVQILESAAKYRIPDELRETFNDWRRWSAAVLESHLAYPILVYFRSSHDNEAWLNSFGAVMDAATLVISTVDDSSEGHARLMYKVGTHLTEDFSWYFGLPEPTDAIVERAEFEQARKRLLKAGYQCRETEVAWREFSALRSRYATALNRLAHILAIVPAEWIGDRTYLPHRRRQPARAVAVGRQAEAPGSTQR